VLGLYVLCTCVMSVALARTELLPFVDYPQHLHLSRLLADYLRGVPDVRALYSLNLASYNAGFHTVTALLGLVVPIATAGRAVLGATLALFSFAGWRLVRRLALPPERAFVVLVVLPGYWLAWGFVNFGMGLAVGLLLVAQYVRPSISWTWRDDASAAALGLCALWVHLMSAALCVGICSAMLGVEAGVAFLTGASALASVRPQARRAAPLTLPIVAAALIYRAQESGSFRNYEYAQGTGEDVSVLQRVLEFPSLTAPMRSDGLDALLVGVCSAALLLGMLAAVSRPTRSAVTFAVVALGYYLLVPLEFWATSFVFPRFGVLVLLGFTLACPPARRLFGAVQRGLFVVAGVASTWLFFDLMGRAALEFEDLRRVVTSAPRVNVTGLVWRPGLQSFSLPVTLHAPAYVAAYGGGSPAFSFTRTMSLPIHYKPEREPPRAPRDLEWRPQRYDGSAAYARAFPALLIHTRKPAAPASASIPALRPGTELRELAHSGDWWLVVPLAGSDPLADGEGGAPWGAGTTTLKSVVPGSSAMGTQNSETCFSVAAFAPRRRRRSRFGASWGRRRKRRPGANGPAIGKVA
jgi:hypothetical protein